MMITSKHYPVVEKKLQDSIWLYYSYEDDTLKDSLYFVDTRASEDQMYFYSREVKWYKYNYNDISYNYFVKEKKEEKLFQVKGYTEFKKVNDHYVYVTIRDGVTTDSIVMPGDQFYFDPQNLTEMTFMRFVRDSVEIEYRTLNDSIGLIKIWCFDQLVDSMDVLNFKYSINNTVAQNFVLFGDDDEYNLYGSPVGLDYQSNVNYYSFRYFLDGFELLAYEDDYYQESTPTKKEFIQDMIRYQGFTKKEAKKEYKERYRSSGRRTERTQDYYELLLKQAKSQLSKKQYKVVKKEFKAAMKENKLDFGYGYGQEKEQYPTDSIDFFVFEERVKDQNIVRNREVYLDNSKITVQTFKVDSVNFTVNLEMILFDTINNEIVPAYIVNNTYALPYTIKDIRLLKYPKQFSNQDLSKYGVGYQRERYGRSRSYSNLPTSINYVGKSWSLVNSIITHYDTKDTLFTTLLIDSVLYTGSIKDDNIKIDYNKESNTYTFQNESKEDKATSFEKVVIKDGKTMENFSSFDKGNKGRTSNLSHTINTKDKLFYKYKYYLKKDSNLLEFGYHKSPETKNDTTILIELMISGSPYTMDGTTNHSNVMFVEPNIIVENYSDNNSPITVTHYYDTKNNIDSMVTFKNLTPDIAIKSIEVAPMVSKDYFGYYYGRNDYADTTWTEAEDEVDGSDIAYPSRWGIDDYEEEEKKDTTIFDLSNINQAQDFFYLFEMKKFSTFYNTSLRFDKRLLSELKEKDTVTFENIKATVQDITDIEDYASNWIQSYSNFRLIAESSNPDSNEVILYKGKPANGVISYKKNVGLLTLEDGTQLKDFNFIYPATLGKRDYDYYEAAEQTPLNTSNVTISNGQVNSTFELSDKKIVYIKGKIEKNLLVTKETYSFKVEEYNLEEDDDSYYGYSLNYVPKYSKKELYLSSVENFKGNKSHGPQYVFSSSGDTLVEKHFIDGMRNGLFKEGNFIVNDNNPDSLFEDIGVLELKNYVNDTIHGIVKITNQNIMDQKLSYNMGVLEGEQISYFAGGIPLWTIDFKNGYPTSIQKHREITATLRHRIVISYNDTIFDKPKYEMNRYRTQAFNTGVPMEAESYVYTEFNDDNTYRMHGNYVPKVDSSFYLYYKKHGKLSYEMQDELYYEGIREYMYQNNPKELILNKFVEDSTWTFYDIIGRKRYTVAYTRDSIEFNNRKESRDGIYEEFNRDGKMISQGDVLHLAFGYDCHTDVSTTDAFVKYNFALDENGDTTVKDGTGHIRIYTERGTLKAEGDLYNGMYDGEWRFYDADERLTEIGMYQDGKKVGKWMEGDLEGISAISDKCFSDWLAEEMIEQMKKDAQNKFSISVIIYKNGEELSRQTYRQNIEYDPYEENAEEEYYYIGE